MIAYSEFSGYIMIVLIVGLHVTIIAGFIYRVWRARKRGGKAVKSEAKKYVGKVMMQADPITGLPININTERAIALEYMREHFEEGQNDETGIYGKEKTDF
jgi:flagellar basal body-associated protein FliL